MIKITQSGENVKYYTGALKDENGDNLEYDEDGTLASKGNTGYMPYASENLMQLCFRAENGYIITKIKTDDDGGSCWLVTITLSFNGQNVKKWIRINVVSAQKSLIKSVEQMSANEIKILFYDNLTEEIAESDIIIFKKSESNEGNMSIESIRPLEDSKCAYIVKLTQKMDNQTEYVVSVSGSSKSFISSNNTVSKIE